MSANARTQGLMARLSEIVGEQGIMLGTDKVPYEQGARYGSGAARLVVRPATVAEVSEIIELCVHHRIPVIPQGANTGLVGAGTPDQSGTQLVLSTSRMRRQCVVDETNRTVTADAGVLLKDLNEKLRPHGLWFPIDLSANPSVGGMIAANTGGTRLIRYGDVRRNLLGVEVVLFDPPGATERFGRALRKDNTGFDLKQLFVGTSGCNGVITQATLEVRPVPQQSATALVVPESDESVTQLLRILEQELGDFMCAFEGMSASAMRAAIEHVPSIRNPFAPGPVPEFALLVELESSSSRRYSGIDLQDSLNRLLEDRFGHEIENAVVGSREDLWNLRHSISEGVRSLGTVIAFDVAVPRSRIMEFCREARVLVTSVYDGFVVADFGHIADGGVHFNIVWPREARQEYDQAVVMQLREGMYALVDEYGGSISAEHGIGPYNVTFYRRFTPSGSLALAGDLQRRLDPSALCGRVYFGS